MTPPREPDRYDKQAEEIVDRLNAGLERYDQDAIARALRAAEASALERAARLVDDSDLYICGDEIRALASPAPSPEAPPDLTGHQCVSCAPPEPVAPAPSDEPHPLSLRAEFEKYKKAEKRIAELEKFVDEALDINSDCDHPPGCECPWCDWAWRAANTLRASPAAPGKEPRK